MPWGTHLGGTRACMMKSSRAEPRISRGTDHLRSMKPVLRMYCDSHTSPAETHTQLLQLNRHQAGGQLLIS